ncbi:hypothetical protein PMAYCL1PPCAC_21998 [Pristionchus mayeri]|uniref:Uncharacterized protein n=1 Tax=Pristionchus mayeri TaxID=1317129 RepID=A0AAN5CVX8_9BILA|nr:hypothetical protein PMAYCL1PPCAC_21998 [Pristionchus mayeri]
MLDSVDLVPWSSLEVTLNGFEDPIQDQVSSLLSSCINSVRIDGWTFTLDSDFPLYAHMLRNSTVVRPAFRVKRLDDSTAAHIHSLTPQAENIFIACSETQLSAPAIFIAKLTSDASAASMYDFSSSTSSFFNLTNSFWQKFLNEKLSNSSFKFIKTGNMKGKKIKKAPFVLPDTDIGWLKYHKKI